MLTIDRNTMDRTVYSEPKQRHMWNETNLHLLLHLAGHRSMCLHSFCSSIYITHDMEQKKRSFTLGGLIQETENHHLKDPLLARHLLQHHLHLHLLLC